MDFIMNLKNNKGYVGVDISLAVIILLIFVPTIMGMVYLVNSSKSATIVKTEAMNIAVNAIEIAKGIDSLQNLTVANVIEQFCTTYSATSTSNSSSARITTETASYTLGVQVTDYASDNKVKTVKAIVAYKIGNDVKTLELSTVIY